MYLFTDDCGIEYGKRSSHSVVVTIGIAMSQISLYSLPNTENHSSGKSPGVKYMFLHTAPQ